MAYIARDLYNNPDKRADIIGVEIEENQPIVVNPITGTAVFYVRKVTAFDADTGQPSTEFGVASERIEITYDAITAFLTKCLNDAKQQNKIKNGTITVAGAPGLPLP